MKKMTKKQAKDSARLMRAHANRLFMADLISAKCVESVHRINEKVLKKLRG